MTRIEQTQAWQKAQLRLSKLACASCTYDTPKNSAVEHFNEIGGSGTWRNLCPFKTRSNLVTGFFFEENNSFTFIILCVIINHQTNFGMFDKMENLRHEEITVLLLLFYVL